MVEDQLTSFKRSVKVRSYLNLCYDTFRLKNTMQCNMLLMFPNRGFGPQVLQISAKSPQKKKIIPVYSIIRKNLTEKIHGTAPALIIIIYSLTLLAVL